MYNSCMCVCCQYCLQWITGHCAVVYACIYIPIYILALVVLSFHQPAQVLYLHPQWWLLAATGVGGVFPSAILAQTVLAPVVVSPIATCAGGLFPSPHWCTYSTCARATFTVWWYIYNIYYIIYLDIYYVYVKYVYRILPACDSTGATG